jgi:glucosamine-6-phosphate deaminase
MTLTILDTENDFDREAAMRVTRQILIKPDSLIGLATGNTTLNIYGWMVKFHKELGIDYSRAKTCNLDEYVGIAADDSRGCRYRIDQTLLKHINIKYENTYVPNGLTQPPEKELEVFRKTVEGFGGIDLQVLSIGANGHIAFNEPGTPFDSTYRIAPISQNTVEDKARLFGGPDKVPRHGLSMGIRDIMSARKIMLVAKGSAKAPIIQKIMSGVMTTDVPATVLLLHPDLEIVVDRQAAP